MDSVVGTVIAAWDESGWLWLVEKLLSLTDYVVLIGGGRRTVEEAHGIRGRRGFVFIEEKERRGKPFAVSLGIRVAWSLGCRYVLLTDADIVELNLTGNALDRAVKLLGDPSVAGVAGRIRYVSRGLGAEWGRVAEEYFHRHRLTGDDMGRVFLTGYLSIVDLTKLCSAGCPEIPGSVVDDAFITLYLWSRGYRTRYAPWISVVTGYPSTFSDYVKQKRRNMLGVWRAEEILGLRVRDFVGEALGLTRLASSMTRKALVVGALASSTAWLTAKIAKLLGRGATDVWETPTTTKHAPRPDTS